MAQVAEPTAAVALAAQAEVAVLVEVASHWKQRSSGPPDRCRQLGGGKIGSFSERQWRFSGVVSQVAAAGKYIRVIQRHICET